MSERSETGGVASEDRSSPESPAAPFVTDAAASAPSNVFAGCLMLCGTVLCFSCTDAAAKWLASTGGVSPLQILGVRYVGSFLIVLLLLNPCHVGTHARTRRPGLQIARSCCLVLSTACSYYALQTLALMDLTTLIFTSPLIIPLLAIPLLGEKVGPRRIAAIAVGFVGVLVVTRPGFHSMPWQVVLPIIGAFLNAIYSIATRKLAASDPPETTMFYTGLSGSVVTLPLLFLLWRTPENPAAWVLLGVMAVLSALAHWLLIQAHKRAPATALAPFNYVQILGAALLACLVFNETPDSWTLTGGGIIISSGLYVLYRERVRRRERQAAAASTKA